MTAEAPGVAGRRWMLALVSAAEILGMSPWFSAAAVAPGYAELWGLDLAASGWLVGAVQLGFVAGTAIAAAANLADLLPSGRLFALSAAGAAAANGALLMAPGFGAALVARFATGLCLAGVYPPAMKMIATWYRRSRGLAIGTVVGALTVGKALPYLVRALEPGDPRSVVGATSAAALLAAGLVALLYRDGPHAFPRRPFDWRLTAKIVRHRPTRLAIAGYLGHMWELYAMWTWIPAFLAASLASGGHPARLADPLAFGAIAAGALGCVWGGYEADRAGRERLVNRAMAASGCLAVAIALVWGAAPLWLAIAAWAWGFFVVADSAQFSTLVTEVAPPHAVGTALTLQTSTGFLLTLATIELVPLLAGTIGWRWAFAPLVLGPAFGIAAIRRLRRLRRVG